MDIDRGSDGTVWARDHTTAGWNAWHSIGGNLLSGTGPTAAFLGERIMASSVADVMVAMLKASGVRRVYGIPGDSLNGFTDAMRRAGGIAWQHVRHEEAAAFAAAAEAALTGELAELDLEFRAFCARERLPASSTLKLERAARHLACADSMSLRAIATPAAREPGPLVTR